MSKLLFSAAAGVISAVTASLCCIGPALVSAASIGSVGAFSVFESYRPFFIGVTALLLGIGFFMTYRKREVKCEDGACVTKDAGKRNKILMWIAAFVSIGALSFPYLGASLLSADQPDSKGKPKERVVLKVNGMTCGGCARGVEATLKSVEGIHKAAVSYESAEAVVDYDPALIQPETIIAKIEELGYSAVLLRQESTR